MKADVYERITAQIVTEFENGVALGSSLGTPNMRRDAFFYIGVIGSIIAQYLLACATVTGACIWRIYFLCRPRR